MREIITLLGQGHFVRGQIKFLKQSHLNLKQVCFSDCVLLRTLLPAEEEEDVKQLNVSSLNRTCWLT